MAQRNVSSQDVYNYLLRFETFEKMEEALIKFTVDNIVLEYKNKGNHVEVTVDGATQAIRVPIKVPAPLPPEAPEAKQEPVSAPKSRELPADELVEDAPLQPAPAARAKKGAKKAPSVIKLTIHGVEVNYHEHVRQLVSHIVNKFDESYGEKITKDWIKLISGEGE